jgi:hypothetical protein
MANKIIRTGIKATTCKTNADVAAFAESWAMAKLDNNEWTHAAHLVVGTWFLHTEGDHLNALNAMRPRIFAYNKANGQVNSETDGYHETVTDFMLRAQDYVLDQLPDDTELIDKVNAVLASDLSYSKFPFFFYTHDHLLSVEARKGWVEPNLRPLSDFPKMIKVRAGI